jgi:HD-like signal output (HDOD) protein
MAMAIKGLDNWIRKLTKQNMPVVGKIIAELNSLTGSDESDVNQLAEVILRDPNLTSHVLRVANSVHYNQSSFPINTVSRAIVLIGLKGMRAVCISLLLIDNLLKGSSKERLLQLMAQGIHAATQARDLIKFHDEEAGEEVFIAALLFNLGEMAFLANEKISDENAALLDGGTKDRKEVMEELLGTSFRAISRGLAKYWKLGETLEQALYPSREPSSKVQAVVLGERMSRAALKGWDSTAAQKVAEEMARYTYLEPEQCLALAQESAERSAEVALHYGAPQACPLIPGKAVATKKESTKSSMEHKIMRPDAQLQLNILRELTTASSEHADVNTIFQMVIEGMHRGVGIERVAVAFIQHHAAKAKYVLGEGTEDWRRGFDFDVGPYTENIFTHAIEAGGATWIDADFVEKKRTLYSADIIAILGRRPAFIYALEVSGRTPAIFYADRYDFGGKLSKEQFESFRHFASQAQLNLNMISQVVPKPRAAR